MGEAASFPLLLMGFQWMGLLIPSPDYLIKLKRIYDIAPGQAAIYWMNKTPWWMNLSLPFIHFLPLLLQIRRS